MVLLDMDIMKILEFVMCGEFQSYNPDWIHFRRVLMEFEFMLVTEGTLYISNGTSSFTVSKGEFLIMPSTETQYGTKSSACSFYWLHFTCEKSQLFLEEEVLTRPQNHLLIPIQSTIASPERIIILLKQLQDCALRYHDAILLNSLTLAILAETANQCSILEKHAAPYSGEQLYHDVRNYIHYHAAETKPIGEISNHFGYSQKYLTSFFRKHHGCSIKRYVLQCKIEIAKVELSQSNHSISQIALSVGFLDVHNFSHAFKKIVGLSPRSYRDSFAKHSRPIGI